MPDQKLPFKNKEQNDVFPVNNRQVKRGTIAYSANQTLPNAMAASLYSMVISKQFPKAKQTFLRCWAREQMRFALLAGGKNKADHFSYVVGYGKRYPQNPQSRVAACDFKSSDCDYTTALYFAQKNPNVLVGALVAGPDANITLNDIRTDDTSKVGVDYNMALPGLFAAFNDDQFAVTNDDCAYGKGVYQAVTKNIKF
jgi:hypothetical protein